MKEAATESSIELMVVEPAIQSLSFAKRCSNNNNHNNGRTTISSQCCEGIAHAGNNDNNGLLIPENSPRSDTGDRRDQNENEQSTRRTRLKLFRFVSQRRIMANGDRRTYYKHDNDDDSNDNDSDPLKIYSPLKQEKKKSDTDGLIIVSPSRRCSFKNKTRVVIENSSSNSNKSESCATTIANTTDSIDGGGSNQSVEVEDNDNDTVPSSQVEFVGNNDVKDNDDNDMLVLSLSPSPKLSHPRSLPIRLGVFPNNTGRNVEVDGDFVNIRHVTATGAGSASTDMTVLRKSSRIHRDRLRSMLALLAEGRDDEVFLHHADSTAATRCSVEKHLCKTDPEEVTEIEWSLETSEPAPDPQPATRLQANQPMNDMQQQYHHDGHKNAATTTSAQTTRRITKMTGSARYNLPKYSNPTGKNHAIEKSKVQNTVCAKMLASCRKKASIKYQKIQDQHQAADVVIHNASRASTTTSAGNSSNINNTQATASELLVSKQPQQALVSSSLATATFENIATVGSTAVLLARAATSPNLFGMVVGGVRQENNSIHLLVDLEKPDAGQTQQQERLLSFPSSIALAAVAAAESATTLMPTCGDDGVSGLVYHVFDMNKNAAAAITSDNTIMTTITVQETTDDIFPRSFSPFSSERQSFATCEKSEEVPIVGFDEEEEEEEDGGGEEEGGEEEEEESFKTSTITSLSSPSGPLPELMMNNVSLSEDQGGGGGFLRMGECGDGGGMIGGDDDVFSSGGETAESISTLVVATDLIGYVLCAPFQIGKNIAFPHAAAAVPVPKLTDHAHTTATATTTTDYGN